jgi:hypothetical protein
MPPESYNVLYSTAIPTDRLVRTNPLPPLPQLPMSLNNLRHARRDILPLPLIPLLPRPFPLKPRRPPVLLSRRSAVRACLAIVLRAREADFVYVGWSGIPVAEAALGVACGAFAEGEAVRFAVFEVVLWHGCWCVVGFGRLMVRRGLCVRSILNVLEAFTALSGSQVGREQGRVSLPPTSPPARSHFLTRYKRSPLCGAHVLPYSALLPKTCLFTAYTKQTSST